jgi:hypothetical protein
MSVIWDNNLPVDRNLRKSMDKINNNRIFDSHLAHKNLTHIRDAHLKNEIDWIWTKSWSKYNPYDA